MVFKWVLTAIATGIVTAVVVQIVNIHLAIQNQQVAFQQQLQDRLNAVSNNSEQSKTFTYDIIAQKNIFGSLSSSSTAPSQKKPQTKLPLNLVGTFLQGGQQPYAIIEDDKKKIQDVFNINDMVFGDAKLVAIHADNVEIKRGGQIEILSLDDAPDSRGGGGSPGSGDEFNVDSKELDDALQNLPLLLTQARAVPYFKDGKSVGLRLFSIKSGSLYEKVGLQNGDILKTINGSSLSDISQAMKLFEMLKADRSITVTLERNREDKELHYQIR